MRSLIFIVSLIICMPAPAADLEFGRFFTSPKQREQLDQLRSVSLEQTPEVSMPEDNLPQETGTEAKTSAQDNLVLKGLVYRAHNKSTVWINDGNNYESNIGGQYLQIDSQHIHPDNVVIEMSGGDASVPMKVGQSYNPADKKVKDVVESGSGK